MFLIKVLTPSADLWALIWVLRGILADLLAIGNSF
ncbi:unknown protein [Simkania negevensis Z]|uniref:Uncharacterized protein n=1 Tax=Simkania negevensis (strain ATCC VR-1471 / DSM 27360 / Z) TaxID=331113 RepID=F8L3E1_SIMNZ|nr:unknown protein [Simkania negevensis Z]